MRPRQLTFSQKSLELGQLCVNQISCAFHDCYNCVSLSPAAAKKFVDEGITTLEGQQIACQRIVLYSYHYLLQCSHGILLNNLCRFEAKYG